MSPKWGTRIVPLIVGLSLRIVLPAAAPATLTGCSCAERGSPVVLDEAVVEREPTITVGGEACNAKSVTCLGRDAKDRCNTFWIDPTSEGRCVFAVDFADGKRLEAAIDYELDGEYPCRGNIRPRHDGITRITGG
jgi:hypothetical protein